MQKKQKNSNKIDVIQQRSAQPDELIMVCVDNPLFGHKFAEIFRSLKTAQGKANE